MYLGARGIAHRRELVIVAEASLLFLRRRRRRPLAHPDSVQGPDAVYLSIPARGPTHSCRPSAIIPQNDTI